MNKKIADYAVVKGANDWELVMDIEECLDFSGSSFIGYMFRNDLLHRIIFFNVDMSEDFIII